MAAMKFMSKIEERYNTPSHTTLGIMALKISMILRSPLKRFVKCLLDAGVRKLGYSILYLISILPMEPKFHCRACRNFIT